MPSRNREDLTEGEHRISSEKAGLSNGNGQFGYDGFALTETQYNNNNYTSNHKNNPLFQT